MQQKVKLKTGNPAYTQWRMDNSHTHSQFRTPFAVFEFLEFLEFHIKLVYGEAA